MSEGRQSRPCWIRAMTQPALQPEGTPATGHMVSPNEPTIVVAPVVTWVMGQLGAVPPVRRGGLNITQDSSAAGVVATVDREAIGGSKAGALVTMGRGS